MNASNPLEVWDYTVTKGAKWSESGTWCGADGTPIDLTGATMTVTVKDAEDSSGAPSGTIVASVLVAEAGRLVWGQSVAQVAAMAAGSHWWSGTLALDGAEPVHLWHGRFDVIDVVNA